MLSDERPDQILKEKGNFYNIDFAWLIVIEIGSTYTQYYPYHLASGYFIGGVERFPSACVYSYDGEDYNEAAFEYWGSKPYGHKKKLLKDLYIDKLCDKVEDLFKIVPKVEKPLQKLYKNAIIQYFEGLKHYISYFNSGLSKHRKTDM
ncbi:unnamed protein product [Mucor hiemalis]